MRLSFKFAVFFLLGIGSVVAVHFALRVQRESSLFDEDFRRDHETMGQDLAAAIHRIWQIDGAASAAAFVEDVNVSKSQILIRLVPPDESGSKESALPVEPARLREIANRRSVYSQTTKSKNGEILWTFVPVVHGSDWLGTLELSESMASAQIYVRQTIFRQAIAALIMIAFTGATAFVLGILLVGRPVELLVARARQIASGDFTGTAGLHQHDEFGELARELDEMAAQLAQATTRIEEESAARIEALDQLRHADRLRTIGQLTSGIAHEMGTPLNVVWARAQLILNDPAMEPHRGQARIIIEQSARMTKIIRQLLDFSRPPVPNKTAFELGLVIRKSLDMLRPTLKRVGVNTVVQNEYESVTVCADLDQLHQVACNLFLNAAQAMPDGGTIMIASGRRLTRRTFEPPEAERRYAYFQVRDTGCGIDAENLSRVFDPFYSTKKSGEGTGLGLSISLGIVREHDGWIEVQSREGEGSCFTVYLPMEENACAAPS